MITRRIALSLLIVSACTEEAPHVGADESEIRGRPYFDNCTYSQEQFLYQSLRSGRWLVETPEFLQCMQNGHMGSTFCTPTSTGCTRYISCDEDDRPSVTDALTVASSPNDVEFECTTRDAGEGGAASIADWGHDDLEEMEINTVHLDQSMQNPSQWAGQVVIANTIWHELMHQHGYEHSDDPGDTADEARAYCGRGASWVWNEHSMPYFMGDCLRYTGFYLAERRLAAAGFTGDHAANLERLVEAGMARHGLNASDQVDQAIFALIWQRRWKVSHSGLCLDVADGSSADGAAVNQYTCHTGLNQKWVRLPLIGLRPSTEPMRYVIMNVNSGKCLDRPFGNVANQTPLQQYTCHAGTSQQFILRSTGQWEAVSSSGALSGQCLDIPSFAMGKARLQMSLCKNPATHDITNQVINLIL